jgi:hypothetical protein
MSEYQAYFTPRFNRNLSRYASVRTQVRRRVDRILADPYRTTEALADASGRLNLRGCRSARVDRNFRIIFVVCEECRMVAECEYCFCDGLEDQTIVFLTVGPHDRAYAME